MQKIILQVLVLLILTPISLNAQESTMNWREGLAHLQRSAKNNSLEVFGLYLFTASGSGRWFFPNPNSSSEARRNLSGDQIIEIFQEYIKLEELSYDEVHVTIAHTHPRSTILKQIEEDPELLQDGKSLRDLIDQRGAITNPPSREDLSAPYKLQNLFKQNKMPDVTISSVVVDSVGIYRHRLFKNLKEKVELFPELAGETPYQHLDIHEQTLYDRRMNQELYNLRRRWIYAINRYETNQFAEGVPETLSELRLVYARYGIGAYLEFAPGVELSFPSEL